MSDRLQELLRQRAAIQTHLTWLDREIAQARLADAIPTSIAPEPASDSLLPTAFAPRSDIGTTDPDAIIAGYRQDTQNMRIDLRKGCLLYFFAALAILAAGAISFYFVNRLIEQHSEAPAPAEQRLER